jgi:hypothetical protein
MAFGILTIVIYCVMNAAPHFIYGAGDDALALTVEYGGIRDEEQTKAIQDVNNKKLICQQNGKILNLILICEFTSNLKTTLNRSKIQFWQRKN